jgi:hypothetical protein
MREGFGSVFKARSQLLKYMLTNKLALHVNPIMNCFVPYFFSDFLLVLASFAR